MKVQGSFQVQHIVGEKVVLQECGALQLADMVGDAGCLLGDVCELQGWHARQ